jgi:membrane protein
VFFFLLNVVLPFAVVTALFAMFYKVLPDVRIGWGAIWVGALTTALLFLLGNYLLSFYLSRGAIRSAYGAAGSFVAFLIWIYYSVQIFFFGAEIAHAYTKAAGMQVTPAHGALPVDGTEKTCG